MTDGVTHDDESDSGIPALLSAYDALAGLRDLERTATDTEVVTVRVAQAHLLGQLAVVEALIGLRGSVAHIAEHLHELQSEVSHLADHVSELEDAHREIARTPRGQ